MNVSQESFLFIYADYRVAWLIPFWENLGVGFLAVKSQ